MLHQPVFPLRRAAAFLMALFFAIGASVYAQQPPPPPPPPGQPLTPDQLDDLVAPIALYPDELVSQIMVAATYPLEVVEAWQFLQRNPNLQGAALTQAAQQQDWDPSVQALVLFPDILKQLNADVTWTTDLGNAFLAQQQDVMSAVQAMRQQAQQAGKLQSTDQQTVTDNGGYVDIEPANPDVIYVPVYNPVWIWGAPLWYPYPTWYWPPAYGPGIWFGWGRPINMGLYFGVGWGGWTNWGWHMGWNNHDVIVNRGFIHEHGFNTRGLDSVRGAANWTHNPSFRGGVPYPNARLTDQYRGNVRQSVSPRAMPQGAQNPAGGNDARIGNRQIPENRPAQQQNRSAFGGQENGAAAQTNEQHGLSSMGPARSAPMPQPRAPQTEAPRTQAPRQPAPRTPAPRGGGAAGARGGKR